MRRYHWEKYAVLEFFRCFNDKHHTSSVESDVRNQITVSEKCNVYDATVSETCDKSQLSKDESIKTQNVTSGNANNNMESPSANDAITTESTEQLSSISVDCLPDHTRELLKTLELTELYPKKLTLSDIMNLKSSEAEHRLAWRY